MRKKAFTLIEILIAGAVLGAVVFAILRMSTNNQHQVSLLESEKVRQLTEANIIQCLREIWYTGTLNYATKTWSISFWNDGNGCLTGSTATGIIIKNYTGNDEVNPTEITNYFLISTGTTKNTITIHTESEKNSQETTIDLYK